MPRVLLWAMACTRKACAGELREALRFRDAGCGVPTIAGEAALTEARTDVNLGRNAARSADRSEPPLEGRPPACSPLHSIMGPG